MLVHAIGRGSCTNTLRYYAPKVDSGEKIASPGIENPDAILTRIRVPSAARDFFSLSQPSVQTLLQCSYCPVCSNRMHQHNNYVHTWNIPNTGSHTIVRTQVVAGRLNRNTRKPYVCGFEQHRKLVVIWLHDIGHTQNVLHDGNRFTW